MAKKGVNTLGDLSEFLKAQSPQTPDAETPFLEREATAFVAPEKPKTPSDSSTAQGPETAPRQEVPKQAAPAETPGALTEEQVINTISMFAQQYGITFEAAIWQIAKKKGIQHNLPNSLQWAVQWQQWNTTHLQLATQAAQQWQDLSLKMMRQFYPAK